MLPAGTQQKGVDPEKPREGQGPGMPVLFFTGSLLIEQCQRRPFKLCACIVELGSWMNYRLLMLVHAAEMSQL